MTGACVSFGPKLSHKSGIPVAQVRNCNKNCNKQRYYLQGLMIKTGKKLSGNTVNKTRRGAWADARARWEGKETAALTRSGRLGNRTGSYPDGRRHSFHRVISGLTYAQVWKLFDYIMTA